MQNRYIMAEAVREAYKRGEDDEAMEPIVLVDNTGKPIGRINNQDYVIFYNIRGEREIQLTQAFVDEKFDKFKRKDGMHVNFVTMIEYDKSLNVRVAFPPMSKIQNTLCEVISKNGLTQVKIVESEKAVHMTYYLNGKNDDIFPNEERIIIPSLKGIEFFDKKPEMNISKVTEVIIEKINDDKYDFIFANLANTDVVGHIENEAAIKKAVEVVDMHTGMIVDTAQKKGIITIVTADHGTVEKWLYPDGTIDTGHTDSPVPFILIIPDNRVNYTLRSDGELADIAPTILTLAGLDIPNDMTGRSLIVEPLQYSRRRMLILILDGWGVRDDATGNLIAQANTPVMDKLKHMYPYVTLKAAGEAVGLPAGSVGNSEVGHLHIGAGRRVNSDKVRINQALHDGSYFNNKAFLWAINGVKQAGTQLHLLGIVSFFSSHGSIDYLLALLKMAKKYNVDNVYIHSLLGRRGERPENGARYIEKIERETEELNIGRVVSVIGRHWALDREQHWDRIEKTYRMLVFGDGRAVKTG